MAKKMTNSKSSGRPLESFDPRMIQLLLQIASHPEKAPITLPLPDHKKAFRLKMDLNKLRKDLKTAPHIPEHIRKQLFGLKFSLEQGSNVLTIDHYDSGHIDVVAATLEKIGGADIEVPDLDFAIDEADEAVEVEEKS